MRKKLLSSLSFLLATVCLFATSKKEFLLFDEACMDRYEYVVTKRTARGTTNSNYTTYRIQINDSEYVYLHTATDGKVMANRPAGTKYCGQVVVSESYARQINNNKSKVELVVGSNNGYIVYPVVSADYFFSTDSEMGFSTNNYAFAFNYEIDSKKNLASKDSKGKVFFRERNDAFCPSKYAFRRIPAQNHNPYNDFTLVPDVGMVEKKTGLDAADANNNTLVLKRINGVSLAKYMDAVCNGYVDYLTEESAASTPTVTTLESDGNSTTKRVTTNNSSVTYTRTTNTSTTPTGVVTTTQCAHLYKDLDKGLYYSKNTGALANETCGGVTYNNGRMIHTQQHTVPTTTTPSTDVVYKQPETKVIYKEGPERVVYKDRVVYVEAPKDDFVSKGTTTPPATPSVEYHTVQSKETLYSISRRYGVTVEQLKRWNDLTGNLISPGQLVRVVHNEVLTSKGTEHSASSTVTGSHTATSGTPAPTTRSDYHIVQAKETLYGIAKKYGLTVDRLKQINNLRSNTISIGQRLRLSTVPESYNNVTIPKEYDTPAESKPTISSVPTTTTAPISDVLVAKGTSTTATAQPAVTTTTIVKDELIGKGSSSTTTATDPLSVYDPAQKVHIVGDNETLYTIAKWYGTTVEKLRALNNFDKNEVILPNQKVRVQ